MRPISRARLLAVGSLCASVLGACAPADEGLRGDGLHETKPPPVHDDQKKDERLDPALALLLGDWTSQATGRALHAVASRDRRRIEFRVVDAGTFHGQYAANETRFEVSLDASGAYSIVDRYRPVPTRYAYSTAGYAACLVECTADGSGAALTARLVSSKVFEVSFVEVTTLFVPTSSGVILVPGSVPPPPPPSEIDGCRHKLGRVLTVRLLRKPR